MTIPCLPPPGTASGTTHVLAHRDETNDAAVVALVWGETLDDEPAWFAPDGYFFVPSELARDGYRYVAQLTPPEEVARLRAENERMLAEKVRMRAQFWAIMEIAECNDQVHIAMQEIYAEARAALEPPHE